MCAAGCANSGRTLGADTDTWANSISIGDHLSVLTNSGDEKDLYVTAVNKSGISDNQEFIPFSDIQSIRILPNNSRGSSSTAIMIVLTVVVVAALAVLLESEVKEGFIQPAQ